MTTEHEAPRRTSFHRAVYRVGIVMLAAATALWLRVAIAGRPLWMRRLRDRRRRRVNSRGGTILHEMRMEQSDEIVLADRVRSTIGPLLHEWDLPRIHVMAEGTRVLLHGAVDSDETRASLETAVRAVPGVGTVASYLRVGLLPGESRPSTARHDGPSTMNRRFHDALAHIGVSGRPADLALAEALHIWIGGLPEGERAHVMAHLPNDIKDTVHTERRCRNAEQVETADRLFDKVRQHSGLRPAENEQAVRSIIHELKVMVPEECDDVAAVLPPGLLPLWT